RANIRREPVLQIVGATDEGDRLGAAAVLDREAEVALFHLELGLANDVELDGFDAEALGVLLRRIVLTGVATNDANFAVAGRVKISEQVVEVALEQRYAGRELIRREDLDRDDIVERSHDFLGRWRQRVGVTWRQVETATDITSEQV